MWRERRAFAYYSQHAVPYLSGRQDLHFWGGAVLQICRSEPAVWDAINAVSALFESANPCLDPVFLGRRDDQLLNQTQKEALVWYSRSLSRIRVQIERRNVDECTAMVSCVLFICIEALQGRVEAALHLYQQGVRLILDLRAKTPFGSTKTVFLEDTVIPLFIRLGTVALSISGVPACDLFSPVERHTGYSFTSHEAARATIVAIAAEGMLFHRTAGEHFIAAGYEFDVPQEFIRKQKILQCRLTSWHRAYAHFRNTGHRRPPNELGVDPSAAAVLLTYHAATSVLVSTCLAEHETIYDDYTPQFHIIVEQSRVTLDASAGPDGTQPPFTFEMGVGLPLYLTVLKCRHPGLRREALSLLQKAPRVQGLYKCTPGALLAGTALRLEEEFAQMVRTPSCRIVMDGSEVSRHEGGSFPADRAEPRRDNTDPTHFIPEEARIQIIGIFKPRDTPWHAGEHDPGKWNRDPDQIFLKFARRLHDRIQGTWLLVDGIVPIDY